MGFAGVEGEAGHGSWRQGHQYAAGTAVRESGAAEDRRGHRRFTRIRVEQT